MKTLFQVLGKIVLILLVAGVVIGAAYAAVQSGTLSISGPGGEGRPRPERQFAENERPASGFGDRDFEAREHGEFSLGRGMFGVVGSLVKITVVTLLVLGIQKLFMRWQLKKAPVTNTR